MTLLFLLKKNGIIHPEMHRTFFHLGEGGWGRGAPNPSENRFCENISKYFWLFQGEKIVLNKDVPYDARSLKKIGCK